MIIAAAWMAWWVAPPWPEVRVSVETPSALDWGKVTSDGRSLIISAGFLSGVRLDIYELPSGRHNATIESETPWEYLTSPDGTKVAQLDKAGHWNIHSLPHVRLLDKLPLADIERGKLLGKLPLADIERGKFRGLKWTPDSRYILAFDSELKVFDAHNAALVARHPVWTTDIAIHSDGSHFIAFTPSELYLMRCCIDGSQPTEIIPLPPPFVSPNKKDDPEPVRIGNMVTNRDGSVLFAVLTRNEFVSNKNWRLRHRLGRWDRSTGKWTEALLNEGPHQYGAMTLSGDESVLTFNLSRPYEYKFQSPIEGPVIEDVSEDSYSRETRFLWNATTVSPKCLNDPTIVLRGQIVAQTTERLISFDESGLSFSVYRLPDFALLSKQSTSSTNSIFSASPVVSKDGKWLVFGDGIPTMRVARAKWLPTWVPSWIEELLKPETQYLRIVRLDDGTTTRRLPGHLIPALCDDGTFWTVRQTATPTGNLKHFAERWSPEERTPWWLILLTLAAVWFAMFRIVRTDARVIG